MENNTESQSEEWGGWKFVSEMLDTPHSGIFQTTKCYKKLYDFVMEQKAKAHEKGRLQERAEIVEKILPHLRDALERKTESII